jgi:uncharacterized RDD family membrane protein YckC
MQRRVGSLIYDLQRASMWKRISAFLFDAIMLGIVVVLIGWLGATALNYDSYNNTWYERYTSYAAEYGVDLDMPLEAYETLTPEQTAALDAASAALAADDQAVYAYNMVLSLSILIASLSILLGFIVREFTIPMVLGNGQTLGKKIFGIGVMQSEGIRLSGVSLFIRTVLGKYAIETMIPLLLIVLIFMGSMGLEATLVILALLTGNLILMGVTREHAMIHDKLANTVTIDIASQMIFKTREDMIAYKQKIHAEKAAKEAY